MSEAQTFTSDSSPAPGQTPAEAVVERARNGSPEPFFDSQFTLHDDLLRQAVEEATADQPRYKDYDLVIGRTALIGGGAIQASEVTRIAAVLRSVRAVAPESIEEPQGSGQKTASAETKLRTAQRFLAADVAVDRAGTTLKRSEILPPAKLTAAILGQLEESNDPIIQAIEHVNREYQNNFSDAQLDRLRQDLILTAKKDTVAVIYERYSAKLQKAGESLLRFMMQ